jgi:N-carbamoylputrescine amidase
MSTVTVAATQMACDWDTEGNIARGEKLVREAASQGAQVILLQELFATPYFCAEEKAELFALAKPFEGHPMLQHFSTVAKELSVVLPVSFFERANNAHFNALAVIDADGAILGRYRKSHIPDGGGYEEKFYFNPGDTGFRVWDTAFGRIGCGICWDQWFPECARSLAIQGADILFYPTAIGNEPDDQAHDSSAHWQRAMQGHAASNMVGLVASNRIGTETSGRGEMTFYGSSFIADETGEKVAEAGRTEETVITASFDLEAMRIRRAGWGFFRDRRPDLYGTLMTLEG